MKPASDFSKIREILEFVWNNKHSGFYKEKYKKTGINHPTDIKGIQDFEKIPFLTKDELINTPLSKRTYFKKSSGTHFLVTSGTTTSQQPLIFLANDKTYSNINTINKQVLKGVATTLLLFPPLQLSNVMHVLKANNQKCQLFFGDTNNLELTASMAGLIEIDSIFTSPSMLYFFLPMLEKTHNLDKIRLIILRGEYCSKLKMNFFKKKFKNAYFEFIYGLIESLQLGYRCKYLAKKEPRFFHPIPSFYFETRKSETDDVLVVTSLSKNVPFPLIRYLTSDVVKFDKTECKCGNKTSMEVFGRAGHDVVKFSGVTLYSYLLEKALNHFSNEIMPNEYQVHIYESNKNNKIISRLLIQLIPKKAFENSEDLRLKLEQQIPQHLYLSSKMTLGNLIDKELIAPLKVEFVQQFNQSFKHRRLVNHSF